MDAKYPCPCGRHLLTEAQRGGPCPPGFNEGDPVLATQFLDPTKRLGARVLGDVGDWQPGAGRIWIDLNILSVHLPQMYHERELVLANEENARQAGLCESCLGYGQILSGEDRTCEACGGSGNPKITVSISHDADGSVISGRIEERT